MRVHRAPCGLLLPAATHRPFALTPATRLRKPSLTVAGTLRRNEKVVPTGVRRLALNRASLEPSRQRETDCFSSLSVSVSTGAAAKVAVTARSAAIASLQAPIPLQAPLQPAKLLPAAATGVSVTVVAAP